MWLWLLTQQLHSVSRPAFRFGSSKHVPCLDMQVREEEIEEAHRAQVEQRSAALLAAKAPKLAAIHASRIKTIRQLAARRKAVDAAAAGSQKPHGSIIDKYADYGSSVYAPLQREGRFPDAIKPAAATAAVAGQSVGVQATQCRLVDAETLAPSTLAGLQELQSSLPARALQPSLHKPKPPAKLSYSQRIQAAVEQDVETCMNLLETAKATQGRGVGQVWPHPIDQAGLDGSGKLGSRRSGGAAAMASGEGASAAAAAGKGSVSRPAAGAKAGRLGSNLDKP